MARFVLSACFVTRRGGRVRLFEAEEEVAGIMRRVVTVLTVAVLVGAMLVAMAAPALAQATPVEPLQPPPNCEKGQDRAWAVDPNGSQATNHFDNWLDCVNGRPPGQG